MSATYVVCGSCGADSSQSAEAIRHKPNCPRMSATASALTAIEDRLIEHYAKTGGQSHTAKYAREINRQRDEVARLRAENERLTKERAAVQRAYDNLWLDFTEAASTIESLRSQLAATREGETPE